MHAQYERSGTHWRTRHADHSRHIIASRVVVVSNGNFLTLQVIYDTSGPGTQLIIQSTYELDIWAAMWW
jgi:hypothetical protein